MKINLFPPDFIPVIRKQYYPLLEFIDGSWQTVSKGDFWRDIYAKVRNINSL
jgi:hypothetical protein